jgi:membrane-associated protein
VTELLQPLLLGMDWMDPNWLLEHFGQELFWLSLVIIFVECGLFFPFLPGDTLLFAMGLFISTEQIDVFPGPVGVELVLALLLFMAAAFLGNVAGYEIGRKLGPPLYEREGRILKRKYFDQTTAFFDKHGNKALVIGRFVPFVRTYVTVVAGVTRMDRVRFFLWSAVGAVLWVLSITLLGFFLGSAIPSLGENIDKAIIVILAFSVIPIAYEWWKHRRVQSLDRTA